MLFVHLAREEIIITCGEETEVLPYVDLERVLPHAIVKFVHRYQPAHCCIINGPGGFTPLRIGTVVINLLQQFASQMQLYPCSKIEIYAYAVKENFLPPVGLLGIGQKKNMLWYDFAQQSWSIVDAQSFQPGDHLYFTDRVRAHPLLDATPAHAGVAWTFANNALQLTYQEKTLEIAPQKLTQPKQRVFPAYFLEPSIG